MSDTLKRCILYGFISIVLLFTAITYFVCQTIQTNAIYTNPAIKATKHTTTKKKTRETLDFTAKLKGTPEKPALFNFKGLNLSGTDIDLFGKLSSNVDETGNEFDSLQTIPVIQNRLLLLELYIGGSVDILQFRFNALDHAGINYFWLSNNFGSGLNVNWQIMKIDMNYIIFRF